MIDDRDELFDTADSSLIKSLCERRLGIGADGLILLRNHRDFIFEMIFFNSTGERSTFLEMEGGVFLLFFIIWNYLIKSVNLCNDGV